MIIFTFQPFLRFWNSWEEEYLQYAWLYVSTLLEILEITGQPYNPKTEYPPVSTLLEILVGVELIGDGNSSVTIVSTLLEILATTGSVVSYLDTNRGGFQPFLRFWAAASIHITAVAIMRFQPFLRFWLEQVLGLCLLPLQSVSTLLEILVSVWSGMSRQISHVYVSTLLEILGLVFLVVVGF